MNNVIEFKSTPEELTMSSVELVSAINSIRKDEGNDKVLMHNDLMKRIHLRWPAEIGQGLITLTSYTDKSNRESKCYQLSRRYCQLLCLAESVNGRGAVEEWRDVVGLKYDYSKRYQVSSFGRLRTHPNVGIKGAKAGRIRSLNACDEKGYLQTQLYCDHKRPNGDRKGITTKVARIVALAFIGPRNGLTINHKDGDKKNNRIENLEYITDKENMRHSVRSVRDNGVTVYGRKLALTEAVELFAIDGLCYKAVRRRIHRGWPVLQALKTPLSTTGVTPQRFIS